MGIMNRATEWKAESSAEEKKNTQTKIKKAKSSRECNWIWINGSGGGTSASDSAVSVEVWQKKAQTPLAQLDKIGSVAVHKHWQTLISKIKVSSAENTSSSAQLKTLLLKKLNYIFLWKIEELDSGI